MIAISALFEKWAVIALGGIPNKTQVGDMGIDGRIFPVSATPKSGASFGQLDFMDQWYPIQVKQKEKAGRPDIDSFEAVMMREDRAKADHHPSPRTAPQNTTPHSLKAELQTRPQRAGNALGVHALACLRACPKHPSWPNKSLE